ncbi:hypothetical protein PanWU01x14_129910 [Parasponia andersonii]|uniref:Uncharacterized protein n=1 Tax=Parasponia andersonii TaxID=3476 RepID=A0A2P5CRH7_PARAD|nr:hypothetical protein PanWU01x14_129910 [Parasponia andersonii]
MALFGYLDWVMIIVKRLLQLFYDASTISGSNLTSSFIHLAKDSVKGVFHLSLTFKWDAIYFFEKEEYYACSNKAI